MQIAHNVYNATLYFYVTPVATGRDWILTSLIVESIYRVLDVQ